MCVRKRGNRASQRERQRESVCLDQLHSKSVYSAQFGIKHNRLLSACYCLWCPIKMEFIAALRASQNHTFPPLRSSLSLSHLHFFLFPSSGGGGGSGVGVFSPPLLAAAVRQVVRTAHYRPEWAGRVGREHRHAHLPVSRP